MRRPGESQPHPAVAYELRYVVAFEEHLDDGIRAGQVGCVAGPFRKCPILYELVEEVVRAVHKGFIKVLIVDRGLIDGERMGHLKQKLAIRASHAPPVSEWQYPPANERVAPELHVMIRSSMSRLATGVCALLLGIAIALQGRMAANVLRGDLAAADPPAQFTTGVMVHDYLRSALGSNPVAFAESFYVRFPKVTFGHWPPVYFAIQAAWYLVFPVSPASARILSAAIALTVAAILFLRLRRSCGSIAACAATAVFLSLNPYSLQPGT